MTTSIGNFVLDNESNTIFNSSSEPISKNKKNKGSELQRIKNNLKTSESLLKNIGFLEKAKPDSIKNEQNKVRDFKALLVSTIMTYSRELDRFIGEPFITYFIEEIRFDKYIGELFTEEYFSIVNSKNITNEEKEELFSIHNNNGLLELFNRNIEKIK